MHVSSFSILSNHYKRAKHAMHVNIIRTLNVRTLSIRTLNIKTLNVSTVNISTVNIRTLNKSSKNLVFLPRLFVPVTFDKNCQNSRMFSFQIFVIYDCNLSKRL
jgi:hypothetical protein